MLLYPLANVDTPNSLANRCRRKRLQLFLRLVAPLPKPIRILDLGGTNVFWHVHGLSGHPDFAITLINLQEQPQLYPNVRPRVGDSCVLSHLPDNSFDVVFSNSVIEHLFTFERQQAMAREVQRLAPAFWVQTPNLWFPMEPHFHVAFWQFLPESWRMLLLRHRRCGWDGPIADAAKARQLIREIRLLSLRELRSLFPQATILPEYFWGLVKSWVAIHGFPAPAVAARDATSMPASPRETLCAE